MSTKHTPGPWWFAQHDEWGRYDVGAGDVAFFRSVQQGESGPGEAPITKHRDEHTQANARLAAASPDLLEALKRCEELLSSITDIRSDLAEFQNAYLGQARAAIAKAEGR